jgi:hypothetical protein
MGDKKKGVSGTSPYSLGALGSPAFDFDLHNRAVIGAGSTSARGAGFGFGASSVTRVTSAQFVINSSGDRSAAWGSHFFGARTFVCESPCPRPRTGCPRHPW